MNYQGTLYDQRRTEIATVTTNIEGGFIVVRVLVGGTAMVHFPLKLGCDRNEIALRTVNVLNQTGLVSRNASVELTEVP